MEELQNISKLQFARINLLPIRNNPSPAGTVARQQGPCNAEHHWALPVCCHWVTPSGAHRTLVKADARSRRGRQSHHSRSTLQAAWALAGLPGDRTWFPIAVQTSCIFVFNGSDIVSSCSCILKLMLQVNNAWFVTGAPLLTGEMEGAGGLEHNRIMLTAPLAGTGLGSATEPQEAAGWVASPSFPNVLSYSLGITECF